MDDINLGLGGLHSYDLRSFSQPSTTAEYAENNGGEEGDREENEVCDSGDDSSEGSEDVDEEVDVVSLTYLDEMNEQETNNDLDVLRNPRSGG